MTTPDFRSQASLESKLDLKREELTEARDAIARLEAETRLSHEEQSGLVDRIHALESELSEMAGECEELRQSNARLRGMLLEAYGELVPYVVADRDDLRDDLREAAGRDGLRERGDEAG